MSIQIVEIAQPSVIDTVAVAQPSTVAVVEVRQGPAGAGGGGSATWGSITGTLSSQTDLQTALNLKAPLASPALTGTPTAPTAVTTTSTTQVATTAFVQQELASGVAVAKNLEFLARNETGVTITKGSVVYVSGATGNKPLITLAQANNDANSAQTIGFAKEDIAHNGTGFVIVRGELENVKTFGATEGQQLYLSPTTAGAFTTTKPSAPDHLVYVGIVVAASTGSAFNGTILVAIQNGYELNELHDVAAQSPSAGQFLKRNAGNTLWINSAIVSADISDATSAATANRVVVRDGSGDASFSGVVVSGFLDVGDFGAHGTTGAVVFGSAAVVQFDAISYTYGTGAAAAHRTALGAGATGDQLFTAATPAAARETALNEIIRYAPNAAAARTNPTTQAADDVLTGMNLTAGIWEISFYFSFDSGTCGVQPSFLFGTIASVGIATNNLALGPYYRGGNVVAGIPYALATGVMSMVASPAASQTDFQYVGTFMIPLTGSTTFGMRYAVASSVAGQTVTRRANAFLRARKVNG